MGSTYTRQSTFTDGDTITADLFNTEFDQLVAAFAATSGHSHDGTAGEGGPIGGLITPGITLGDNTIDVTLTFDGGSNDGVLKWMEDEDYFEFSDDILIASTEKLQFRDTAIYINSSADGQLDIVADTEIQIAATTIDINGNADISGNLGIGGNLTVTGTTTFNGGTLTLGDSAADNVVFGADVNSSIIPNTDDTYDLGSASQQWRNLFIDGTAEVDVLSIAGTAVTSTATELNLLDGVSGLVQADLTKLAAVDASAAELNLLDGVSGLVQADFTKLAAVDSTAAELNILDGVTSTAAEINILDGDTSATSTTVVDADRIVLNDNGTMVQVAVTDLAAYFDDEITAMPNLVTTAATTVGALNSGSITSGFGTIDTGSSTITTTGLISGGSLDIDSVLINGTTIGHTDDTDLITLANGVVTVAGEVSMTTLDIGGTNVTSTAAELNILDGKAFLDEDNFASNSATGIASQQSIKAYVDGVTTTSITSTGALNSGSITSGFGTIDTGASGITTTGLISGGSLDIDDVLINGSTIGHTNDTDLITLAANVVTVAGEVSMTTLDIGGTNVTADAGELNTLDGITAVVGELNALDLGDTAIGTAIASKAVVLDSNKDYTGIRNFTITGNLSVGGTTTVVDTVTMNAQNAVLFEGATADAHETTLTIVDPTADRTINLPNQSGTIPVLAAASNTAVTSTPEELNILDGVTSTAAELNILDVDNSTLGDLAEISTVANDDVFLAIDTSGGGLKRVTRSTVVSGLATSSGLSNVVEDTSPQLGGNLDMNGADIVTTSNATIDLAPHGTGTVVVRGNTNSGTIVFNCEDNSHGQTLKAQPHSATVTNTMLLPAGANSTLVSLVSTDTLTNKTLTSPKINEDVAVTSTATEINLLDGVTATTAELNALDGITAVVGELNALDLGSTAVGTAIASKAMVLDSNKDYTGVRNFTLSGELDAGSLDISGNADIDGTLEADAITVNGTALATVIAGTTVTNSTNSAHVLVTDNESTNEENLIAFVEGATSSTGNVGLEMDGNLSYNPSTGTVSATIFKGNIDAVDGDFDGTLEADAISIGGTTITSTAAELNLLAGSAANSVQNSKAVIYGSSGQLAGTLSTAAQTNVTSLGNLTALAVDDVAINGKAITMTGSSSDTAVFTVGTNGTLSIVTTDDAAAAANIQITADGTAELAGTTVTLDAAGDIDLAASADVNIPANVGLTFGNDGEKIEGDGTDLTIAGNNINLTAVADVNIPSGVGLTFATTEKIESDGTDLSITVGSGGDINIPANIGLTFGDDGEKIEGDGTDLTISGADINLTATGDVNIPANIGLTFGGDGEKIEGDGTHLAINSSGDLNVTATTIDINGNVEISGTAVTTGVHTFTAVPVFPNDTVETADIQADAITGAKIADNAINSEHYTDGSIDTAHIADSQITVAKMAANSVDSDQYVDGSIDTAHIADEQITADKLGADSVTADKIGDNVLNSEHYAAGSIDAEHLASDSVTEAKIAANSIDSQAYVDGSIDTAHIADAQITVAKMAANSVDSNQYVDGSIDTAHIADANVTQGKIADQAINEAKMQISNAPTNGYALTAQSGNTGGLTWAEMASGPAYTRAATPPGSPNAGDWWFNTGFNALYIYDGTDGWITNGRSSTQDRTLGSGLYRATNTFSLIVVSGGNIYQQRFEPETAMISDINSNIASNTYDSSDQIGTAAVSNAARGVFTQNSNTTTNTYGYVTLGTNGAASDFGDSLELLRQPVGCDHATRGVFVEGNYSSSAGLDMEYITIATAGNGTNFGDLSVNRWYIGGHAVANTTRGVFCGGYTGSSSNVCDYITIASTGNATDFGNLTVAGYLTETAHSIVRGLIFQGHTGRTNTIDYITIASTGNATDFGDHTNATSSNSGYAIHNKIYAYHNKYSGTNRQEKHTIATAANATQFTWTELANLGQATYHDAIKGWISASG